VEVTGEVPDTSAHLQEAALALIPLRIARGVQNKVLESMAHGLPVVATADVLHTLHPEATCALSMATDPSGLADHVVRLMSSLDARRSQGLAAREFVRRYHDWARLESEWSQLFDEVLNP
jgi:glycosyltransferase involved in cell wall biosynthesis